MGANYEFRVRGVNDAGVGMASMPSDPKTTKAVAGNYDSENIVYHSCVTVQVSL